MTFKELTPGEYKAYIKDWGLEEVAKLDNKLKVVIQFDIESAGELIGARWEGFLENKDGTPNKNTIKTLVTCGFTGNDPVDLNLKDDALDNEILYSLTVIKDGNFNRIQWVNRSGSGAQAGIKKAKIASKSSEKMRLALQDAQREAGVKAIKRVKNHAPGAEDEPLPF